MFIPLSSPNIFQQMGKRLPFILGCGESTGTSQRVNVNKCAREAIRYWLAGGLSAHSEPTLQQGITCCPSPECGSNSLHFSQVPWPALAVFRKICCALDCSSFSSHKCKWHYSKDIVLSTAFSLAPKPVPNTQKIYNNLCWIVSKHWMHLSTMSILLRIS